jgi:hypothetical protein
MMITCRYLLYLPSFNPYLSLRVSKRNEYNKFASNKTVIDPKIPLFGKEGRGEIS